MNVEVHRPWMAHGNLLPSGPAWRPDALELAVIVTADNGARSYGWHRSAGTAYRMALAAAGRAPEAVRMTAGPTSGPPAGRLGETLDKSRPGPRAGDVDDRAFEINRALGAAAKDRRTASELARAAVADGCDAAALAELVGPEELDGLLEAAAENHKEKQSPDAGEVEEPGR